MKRIVLPFLLIIFLMTGCGGGQDSITGTNYNKIIVGIDDTIPPTLTWQRRRRVVWAQRWNSSRLFGAKKMRN